MATFSLQQDAYAVEISEPSNTTRSEPTLGDILCSNELSREVIEISRWPIGPVCVRCGAFHKACQVTSRPGLWTCKACRNCQYTVTSGTPLHGTRIDLSKWVQLFCFKKIWDTELNSASLARHLDVSYLTTRRMIQKITEMEQVMPAMTERLETNLRTLMDKNSPRSWQFD